MKHTTPIRSPFSSVLGGILVGALVLWGTPSFAQEEAPAEQPKTEQTAPEQESAEATPAEEAPVEKAEATPAEPVAEEVPTEKTEAAPAEPVAEEVPAEKTEAAPAEPATKEAPMKKADATSEKPVATPEPTPTGDVEEIVVTGTRIGRSNLEEFAHITVIDSKDIIQSGVATIDELLNQLPSVTLQGINKNSNNGGLGLAMVDLRNLGVERTLVLVNGKRFINSANLDGVDLNNIPVALIERVEVLLDGASAVYGSDAIGGVVNIILKKDFEGVAFDIGGGISQEGDGQELTASATAGINGERGNFTMNLSYAHRWEVEQFNRDWAKYPVVDEWFEDSAGNVVTRDDPNGNLVQMIGSGTHESGRFFGNNFDVLYEPDPSTGLPYTPFGLDSRYNYGEDQFLIPRMERFSATALGHYDLTENIQFYMESTYTNRFSRGVMAPQPVGFGTNAYPSPVWVPTTNPYFPAELTALLDPGEGGAYMLWRASQVGSRIDENESDTYRIVAGIRGDLSENFSYDLYTSYAYHQNLRITKNSVNIARVFESADPALCAAAANKGCVVGDYFGGNLSNDVLDYIRFNDPELTRYSLFTFAGSITGDSSNLFSLPGGPVGIAAGFDLRGETGLNIPSDVNLMQESAGNGQDPTSGGYQVQEVFAELSFPFVKGIIGAEDVTVDLAGRFSNYDTFGNDLTYRAGLSYAPVKAVRLRGIYSTAFRAPSISNLYGGGADSYETLNDPCNNYGTLPANDPIRQACEAEGVAPDYDQNDFGGSQIRTNIGGNEDLEPETAKVINAGVVITAPVKNKWIRGLSATFDYYQIKLDNAITAPTPQWILDSCYNGSNTENCSRIAGRNAQGVINFIDAKMANFQTVTTAGMDFTVNYGLPLDDLGVKEFNRIDIGFHGNYLLNYTEKDDTEDAEDINYDGTITSNYGSWANLRMNLHVAFSGEHWSLLNKFRFIQGADVFDYVNQESYTNSDADRYTEDADYAAHYKLPNVGYWDIVGTFNWDAFYFIAGINNLTNTAPPFFLEGGQNANVLTYDFMGRYFFAKVGYRF